MIFAGKNSAALPSGLLPPNITTACTESHWISQESLLEIVEMINEVMKPIVHANRGSW